MTEFCKQIEAVIELEFELMNLEVESEVSSRL